MLLKLNKALNIEGIFLVNIDRDCFSYQLPLSYEKLRSKKLARQKNLEVVLKSKLRLIFFKISWFIYPNLAGTKYFIELDGPSQHQTFRLVTIRTF